MQICLRHWTLSVFKPKGNIFVSKLAFLLGSLLRRGHRNPRLELYLSSQPPPPTLIIQTVIQSWQLYISLTSTVPPAVAKQSRL